MFVCNCVYISVCLCIFLRRSTKSILKHVGMYLCMHARMNVCVHVCVCVLMCACLYATVYVFLYVCTYFAKKHKVLPQLCKHFHTENDKLLPITVCHI